MAVLFPMRALVTNLAAVLVLNRKRLRCGITRPARAMQARPRNRTRFSRNLPVSKKGCDRARAGCTDAGKITRAISGLSESKGIPKAADF
jgi:hypothetical protein